MTDFKVGDRVKMDTSQTGWLGMEIPDLGEGTVVDVDGEGLMVGWYVEVDWDRGYGGPVRRPSTQSLLLIEEGGTE